MSLQTNLPGTAPWAKLQNWPDGEPPALGWHRPAVSILTRNRPLHHTCTKHSSPECWTMTPSLQANWTLHLPLPSSTLTQAYLIIGCCCSVTKSCPTLCDLMEEHVRLLCPPLCPGVCSNSCPLSWWCYLTMSSSVAPFSFCLQSFPASGSFPMSWLFPSGGQSTGALASVLPMHNHGWFSIQLTGLIFLDITEYLESPWVHVWTLALARFIYQFIHWFKLIESIRV